MTTSQVFGIRLPAVSRAGKKRTAWPERPKELRSVVFTESWLDSPSRFQPKVPLGLKLAEAGTDVEPPLAYGRTDWPSPVGVRNSWVSEPGDPCGYQKIPADVGFGGFTVKSNWL